MADSFASGLARGIQNAQQMHMLRQDQERTNKMAKLQGQLVELQLQQQQTKDAAMEKLTPKPRDVTGLNGESLGQIPPKKLSLLEHLAELSMPELDVLGIKPTDVVKLQNESKYQSMLEGMLPGGSQNSNGVQVTGMDMSSRGPTFKMGMNPQNTPMDANDARMFENPEGQTAPVGMTPAEAMQRGFNLVSSRDQRQIGVEEAGRISGLANAAQIGNQIQSRILNENGEFVFGNMTGRPTVDRTIALTNLKYGFSGEGRELNLMMRDAIDAVLRARTGATANADEMAELRDQFIPDPRDSDKVIANKMDRFNRFINGALDAVTLPKSLKERIDAQTLEIDPADMNDDQLINELMKAVKGLKPNA